MPSDDPRLIAFAAQQAPNVFHSVAGRHDVWKEDPLDIETIHGEARAVFERLVLRATTPPGTPTGRIFPLLGGSGTGKTHLMRAFRSFVHTQQHGYVGYMQMTSGTKSYGRYVLCNLIDSLDKPYNERLTTTSGLMRLSNALAEAECVDSEDLAELREGDLGDEDLAELVCEMADNLIYRDARYRDIDIDLTRALLYLQRDDPRIKARVLRYLRCEDLAERDRKKLGGLIPRTAEEAPQRLVELFGQLIWAAHQGTLVLCIDQLETVYDEDDHDAAARFRRAMTTVCEVADRVPSSIVVISCLEDYFEELKQKLTRSLVDRIIVDPAPHELIAERNEVEIEQLAARRLEHFYDLVNVNFDADDALYPLPREGLVACTGMRTRDILDWCRAYQLACMKAGGLPGELPFASTSQSGRIRVTHGGPDLTDLDQLWNDQRSLANDAPPERDPELIALFRWTVGALTAELPEGFAFAARGGAEPTELTIDLTPGPQPDWQLLLALCNKSSRGGALGRQIGKTEARAGERAVVVLRSTDFPTNPRTKIGQQLAALIVAGGRKVSVEDSDWRAMASFRAFWDGHHGDPRFVAWQRSERPLSQLPSLRTTLDLDRLAEEASSLEAPAAPSALDTLPGNEADPRAPGRLDREAPGASADALPLRGDEILVGETVGARPVPVTLRLGELTTHAAFLGGSGSGKTTLALNVLEQVVEKGVPVILLDRKGDLCSLGSDAAWAAAIELHGARAQRLRDAIEVRIYTPGNPTGRPLAIPPIPSGLGALPTHERERVARFAAQALGDMMGYKQGRTQRACRALLTKAIEVLSAGHEGDAPTLAELIDFVDQRDPALVNSIGRLNQKHFDTLVNDLETLRLNAGSLLEPGPGDARLDVNALLARNGGRTQVSVISTKFLGDRTTVLFWVAQLLLRIARWASRNPSGELQAALLFDEADLYLPATRSPATKEPMEDLLKRARSAGISIFLATQSPGDLDYKCRDQIRSWFLGRVKEATALQKLKPMFSSGAFTVDRLPGQGAGEFHVVRDGEVSVLKARRSVVDCQQLAEAEILALARDQGVAAVRGET